MVVNLEARDYLRPPSMHAGPGSIVGRVRARAVDWYGGPLVVPYSGSFEQRLRDLQTSGILSSKYSRYVCICVNRLRITLVCILNTVVKVRACAYESEPLRLNVQ